MITAFVLDSRFVSNYNPGSMANAGPPGHHVWKVKEERKQESRGRGHFGLIGSLRLSRNARAGCNSNYGDRRLGQLRMASAITRSNTEGRCRTKQYQERLGRNSELLLRLVPRGSSFAVCITGARPRLGIDSSRFKA